MSTSMRQRRRGDADDGVPVSQSKSAITLETFDLYQKVREKEDQIQTTGGATGEQRYAFSSHPLPPIFPVQLTCS